MDVEADIGDRFTMLRHGRRSKDSYSQFGGKEDG